MNRELIERVQAVLKEAGFTNFATRSSAHSSTLSADRGAMRALVHLTDQEELPHAVGLNPAVPAATEIRMKATLPGAIAPSAGRVIGRGGQGGTSAEKGAIRQLSSRE